MSLPWRCLQNVNGPWEQRIKTNQCPSSIVQVPTEEPPPKKKYNTRFATFFLGFSEGTQGRGPRGHRQLEHETCCKVHPTKSDLVFPFNLPKRGWFYMTKAQVGMIMRYPRYQIVSDLGRAMWTTKFQGPRGPRDRKKITPDRKFQSRLKFSISLENFNPGASEFPTKNRGLAAGALENFNPAWNFQSRRAILNFFNLWALRVWGGPQNKESPRQTKPKKGPKRKVHMNLPILVNSGVFAKEKQARFTYRTFVPECPSFFSSFWALVWGVQPNFADKNFMDTQTFLRKNQPEVFLHKVFRRPPRVMDVRAFGSRTSAQESFIFLRSERWLENFWAGTSARISFERPRGVPPRNFMFRLLFRSWCFVFRKVFRNVLCQQCAN